MTDTEVTSIRRAALRNPRMAAARATAGAIAKADAAVYDRVAEVGASTPR